MIRSIEESLAKMQAGLFEMSAKRGYDSERFIRAFMKSEIAAKLDSEFDFLQWAGKEYIMEKMEDEMSEFLVKDGTVYNADTMYWIGYTYRKWACYTGESSREIYKQANAEYMNVIFLAYHCLDVLMAIDRIKETNA